MSIGVLLLSVFFALVEAGLSYLVFAFEPISSSLSGIPSFLLIGGIFAVGMLLAFLLIIIIGAARMSSRAADFVRDYFGKTLVLALISTLLMGVLSMGSETVYQIRPEKTQPISLCFMLDYSGSMMNIRDQDGTTLEQHLDEAFSQTIASLPAGQRVCVVTIEGTPKVLAPWAELSDQASRDRLVQTVIDEPADDGLNPFDTSLQLAEEQANLEIAAGRPVAIIMITDAIEDTTGSFTSVGDYAPDLLKNGVKVFTLHMMLPEVANAPGNATWMASTKKMLDSIAMETGGTFLAAEDMGELGNVIDGIATQAGVSMETGAVMDTVITPRNEMRPTLIHGAVMRCVLVALLVFLFKLISGICIGKTDRGLSKHLLTALVIGILSAAVLEVGYMLTLPVWAVLGVFWLLVMVQIVPAHT